MKSGLELICSFQNKAKNKFILIQISKYFENETLLFLKRKNSLTIHYDMATITAKKNYNTANDNIWRM